MEEGEGEEEEGEREGRSLVWGGDGHGDWRFLVASYIGEKERECNCDVSCNREMKQRERKRGLWMAMVNW